MRSFPSKFLLLGAFLTLCCGVLLIVGLDASSSVPSDSGEAPKQVREARGSHMPLGGREDADRTKQLQALQKQIGFAIPLLKFLSPERQACGIKWLRTVPVQKAVAAVPSLDNTASLDDLTKSLKHVLDYFEDKSAVLEVGCDREYKAPAARFSGAG